MSNTKPKHIVVMTGATAGIGAHAIRQIVAEPGTHAIIGARGSNPAIPEGAEAIPLDLASLASVRAFADAVKHQLGDTAIDMLVFNAGAQFPSTDQRSADGFEMTFAVNHLAHYLLARLLLPVIAEGGRLVITTSDTHDPAITSMAPRALDPQTLARPERSGGFGAGGRAYAASKLCNLLTARSFAALDEVKDRNITVIAYNPGLTVGTSLMRAAPRWMHLMTSGLLGRLVFGLAGRFNSALYPGTPERAGEVLAQLTLGTVAPPPGRVYASLVKGKLTFPDPSELARSDKARDLLWRESAAMVGIRV